MHRKMTAVTTFISYFAYILLVAKYAVADKNFRFSLADAADTGGGEVG
jgi:hypothetical protein